MHSNQLKVNTVRFSRLADYKKGGELINVYNNGGQDEAEKFIVEKLPGLMYNSGKGQVINRNDYLRWKFQNRKHVRLNYNILVYSTTDS